MGRFFYRLLMTLIAFTVLPMSLFTVLAYRYVSDRTERQTRSDIDRNLQQIQGSLEDWLNKLSFTYENLYLTPNYADFFMLPERLSELERNQTFDQIRFSFLQVIPPQSEMFVMDKQGALYANSALHVNLGIDLLNQAQFKSLFRNSDSALHFLPYEQYRNFIRTSSRVMLFERNKLDPRIPNKLEWNGAVFLLINEKEFIDRFGISGLPDGRSWLIDSSGQTVYSSTGSAAPQQSWPKNVTLQTNEESPGWFTSTRTIGKQWTLVHQVEQASLVSNLRKTSSLLWIVAALSIVCAVLVSWYASYRLSLPLSRLVLGMRKVQKGRFETIPLHRSGDELYAITSVFNQMSLDLQRHIEQSFVLQLRNKEARLLALQSQINPHFLFNTLESIRYRVMENNDRETGNVIKTLALILRNSLYDDHPFVTLEQEMDMIRNYLSIQIYRYGERLRCRIETDESCRLLQVPRLIIQPVVENAIIHGLETKVGPTDVLIRAIAAPSGDLEIRVTDSGSGMNGETLRKVRDSLLETDMNRSRSIGLVNVHQRLQVLFGPPWGIDVESEEGRGTEVVIRMPRQPNVPGGGLA